MPSPVSQPSVPASERTERSFAPDLTAAWIAPGIVGLATVVGFIIRCSNLDQGLIADELSTYWIIHGRSFGDVISIVHSDAEITPPFYFGLAWVSSKLGSDAELLRLPNLIAGTVSIPLIYMLGSRTIGRLGGVVAAVLMALSPFMIFYSTEARAYSVMIALLITSTLALVSACDTGRKRWWALYAVCVCAAMYTHYTVIFCLIAQFLWAIWAYPSARKGLLLATGAAVVGFMPWIGGFIADNNSPTTDILDALQPFNLGAVKFATGQWAAGYPYVPLRFAPGRIASVMLVIAAVIVVIGIVWRLLGKRRDTERRTELRLSRPIVLVVMLAVATPAGEALSSALGTNLYGARNLNAGFPGLALLAGAAISAAAPLLAVVAGALVLAAFGIAASKTLDADFFRTDYRSAAAFVDSEASAGDVVLDASAFTPVPATGLDVFLDGDHQEFRLNYPQSDEPFNAFDYVPPPERITNRSFRSARGHRLFLVRFASLGFLQGGATRAKLQTDDAFLRKVLRQHDRFRITQRHYFPGIPPVAVFVFDEKAPAKAAGTSSKP